MNEKKGNGKDKTAKQSFKTEKLRSKRKNFVQNGKKVIIAPFLGVFALGKFVHYRWYRVVQGTGHCT